MESIIVKEHEGIMILKKKKQGQKQNQQQLKCSSKPKVLVVEGQKRNQSPTQNVYLPTVLSEVHKHIQPSINLKSQT